MQEHVVEGSIPPHAQYQRIGFLIYMKRRNLLLETRAFSFGEDMI